jgi:two-component sensor histidine kinase/DNA-binding NarL/FixJ family response regulator
MPAAARILIVEDEAMIAKTLQKRLTRAGFNVIGMVPSGEEAIRLSETGKPDLALMDMTLGGQMDGIQTAQQLRDQFNVPTVYLTANCDIATLQRSKQTRPLGYLLKPYNEDDLLRTLELALHNHETEEALRQRELQHRYLSDATQVLISSLDPLTVLTRFAEFTIPMLGDFCIFHAVLDEERLRRVASAHVDPEKKVLIEKAPAIVQRQEFTSHLAVRALITGAPVFEPHVTSAFLNDLNTSHRLVVEELECHAMMALPLIAHEKKLGALTFGLTAPERFYSTHELELGVELARRATIALERAQMYQQSLNQIQELKRSERIIEDLNRSLESRVAERTSELEKATRRIEVSLREKEVLLKEIHHRVKNNLQIISSLLRLQSQTGQDSRTIDILQQCRSRVQSMALVHELLYQSKDMTSIGFRDYLSTLARNLLSTYQNASVNLEIDVQDVNIDLDTAIPAGLIAAELITNALKYAFNEGRPGRLLVRFASEGDGLGRLTIEDNGPGIPSDVTPERSPTLGLRIVSTLCQQLEGRMDRQQTQGGGASFQLVFPFAPVKKGLSVD